jgi:DHA1 family tetracycline resistance protein-like MFS transporter
MGFFIGCYAMMQFIFSPILGSLSDKIGRRPVLLISLAGSTISYLLLAFSSHLSWLFIGRIIAGMTSANMAVASAYIVDISSTENRAKYFGRFNAMFGLGFIIGPVLGGLLGQYGLKLPFLIAALLTGSNFLIALFALAESRPQHAAIQKHASLNPFKIFKVALSQRNLIPLMVIFFIFSACGEAYGVCWALWGHDTFHWNSFWVGLSLGTFGLCQVLVQSLLPQHAVKFWGERNTVLIGLGCLFVALNIMAFAQQGWIIFVIMPIFALGSIGTPSLQALASTKVSADQQGQFQGLIASTVSLASVIAPLFFSSIYFHFHTQWSGAIWLIVAIIYLFVLPLILFQLKAKPL